MANRTQPNKISVRLVTYDADTKPSRNDCRKIVQHFAQSFSRKEKPYLLFDDMGKPSITNNNQLRVSYAHSANLLAIVYSTSANTVGIDTEPDSRSDEVEYLQVQAFSISEISKLDFSAWWLEQWCLKEAVVKQLGTGFRHNDPSQFTVTTKGDSYTLYRGDIKLMTGYWYELMNSTNDNTIIVSTDRTIGPIDQSECSIKELYKLGIEA